MNFRKRFQWIGGIGGMLVAGGLVDAMDAFGSGPTYKLAAAIEFISGGTLCGFLLGTIAAASYGQQTSEKQK